MFAPCIREIVILVEDSLPFLLKLSGINHLIFFSTASCRSTRANAFIVNYFRPGLIHYLHSQLMTDSKTKVCIFIVSRSKISFKTMQILEDLSSHHQTGTRTIVYRTQIIILRVVGIILPTIVPPRSILPNNAPSFL